MSDEHIIIVIIAVLLAGHKNRSMLIWGVLTFFIWWMVFVLAVLPRRWRYYY